MPLPLLIGGAAAISTSTVATSVTIAAGVMSIISSVKTIQKK